MTSKEMAKLAIEGLEDKKAEDIKVIDISNVSVMADYFIIASGLNRNQVQALADNVEEKLHDAKVRPRQIEGYQSANWILMDNALRFFCAHHNKLQFQPNYRFVTYNPLLIISYKIPLVKKNFY